MALEQFKTQVLLLHSQQSTLDALGAGVSVSDKYSVHFATSGTEALTTLGETPIHVIVSAQDLPGMSGLEALREAKKRSPDTIGILLAGSDRDDGLEALVGDKEVFQIVRGAISPDALLNIIETATKRVRMLAISESANDTAADVDHAAPESSGEHIIMETAENGATIISDGTGRLPALKPEKIQVSPEAGGREVDVLVLSKDEEFLKTIQDSSRGMHNVHHAHTAGQAQEIVRNHKVGVLVTDAAIAGSKIQVLTQALRRDVPRLVAVVAGRRDDGELLMDLINQGQVYRFLLKPVSPGRARLAIEASVKHHLDAPDAAFKGKGNSPARNVQKPQPVRPAAKAAPPKAAPARQAQVEPKADAADDLAATGRRKAPVIKPIGADTAADDDTKPSGMGLGSDTLGEEPSTKMPLIAAAGAAIALLAVGIWFFVGGADDKPVTEPVAEPVAEQPPARDTADPGEVQRTPAVSESDVPQQPAGQTSVEPAPEPEYVALLDDARFARDAGRIVTPAGDNAVEYYVTARAAAPENDVIAEELTALTEQVLAMAETALLEERLVDARAALGMVALADPGNARLGFLNAQLSQLQLRATLDDVRLAIRESRFEDAAALLAEGRNLAGDNQAEIDLLDEDLAAARSAQQVDEVLALANRRLAQDRLTSPSNDNARYYFELALGNDPGNMAAQQGLDVIAGKLVLRARSAIDSGDLEQAAGLLGEARALDPDSGDLESSTLALQNAREQQAAAERQAAIARQEAARQAEAERQAALKRRTGATATLSTTDDAEASDVADAGEAASFVPASMAGASKPGAAGSAEPEEQADGDAEGTAGEGARIDEPRLADIVAVSELVRVNYVSPEYPRSAQRRNITGWVDVTFTVSEDGTVSDLEVMDSTPGTVFDNAATDAVGQWRFEPVIENGVPVRKRTAVRMSFSLE